MEDIRAVEHLLRLMTATLYQVVVIGIHTGDHITSERFPFEEVHQHRFLTTRQISLGGQHHLEIAFVVLKLAEDRPPEIDIIIALDVGNDPTASLL